MKAKKKRKKKIEKKTRLKNLTWEKETQLYEQKINERLLFAKLDRWKKKRYRKRDVWLAVIVTRTA